MGTVHTPGQAGANTPGQAARSHDRERGGQPPVVLTIAGSDSGGGAGIQADLATFAGLGVLGTTAVTAVTAQSTTAITGIVALAPQFVASQIETVLQDISVAAVKTGMLAGAQTIAEVGRVAASGVLPNLVVDPVLAASTGGALAGEPAAAVDAYRRHLLPFAAVSCPNALEAIALAGINPPQIARGAPLPLDLLVTAGKAIVGLGTTLVVVTGGDVLVDDVPGPASSAGHTATVADTRPGDIATAEAGTTDNTFTGTVDVVVSSYGTTLITGPRVPTANTHGTGCTFSAAVAAGLALGLAPLDAVQMAKRYVTDALLGARSWRIGAGAGPLDHGTWRRPAAPAT